MRSMLAIALVAIAFSASGATLNADGVVVEFPPDLRALAELSQRTVVESRQHLSDKLPKSPPIIRVKVCETAESFKEIAGPLSTFSVVGVALPEQDLIVLKSPALTPPGSNYAGTIRHELVHVLLRHNFNTNHLPRWLNEGLSMVWSDESRWQSRSAVAQMYLDGRMLRYDELEASFLDPGQEQRFGDAYAEAYSLTQFLQARAGNEKFHALLRRLDNQPFAAALDAELGIVPYDLWEAWRESLQSMAFVTWIISGILLFQITAVLTILAFWRKSRRGKRVIAQWEEDEREEDRNIPPAE